MALKIVQDTCSNWTGYDIKIEQNKNYMQNKKKLEAFGWHVYTEWKLIHNWTKSGMLKCKHQFKINIINIVLYLSMDIKTKEMIFKEGY